MILRGPRRLGKSSILTRISEEATEKGLLAVYTDVGGASSVENFLDALEQVLPDSTVAGYLKRKSKQSLKWVSRLEKATVTVAGVKTEIDLNILKQHSWYARAMQFQQRIMDVPVIIQIDEFSVFLEKLLKTDSDAADALLSWMRTWRTSENTVCRFIYTGSIGINHLLECHHLDTRLNDCYEMSIPPFKAKAAHEMIVELARREDWQISQQVVQHLCDRTGWLSPYFVALLLDQSCLAARDRVEELIAEGERSILIEDVNDGYERLITSRSRFVHWEKRLSRHLADPELFFCKDLLTYIAKSKDGLTLKQLSMRLAKREANPDKRENQMQQLLRKLEDEGYLTPADDKNRVRFLSFLLRDYWKRNHG